MNALNGHSATVAESGGVECLALAPVYPALSRSELDAVEERLSTGVTLTRLEMHRLEQQGTIVDGEFLITCHRGQVSTKRYLGIDLAEI